MKIGVSILALALAQEETLSPLRTEVQESRNNREGNPTIIELALQSYYNLANEDWQQASKLLQYGCYCQILNNEEGRHGMGEPVDALDEICKTYHQCSKCTGIEFGDQTTIAGDSCDWQSALYEIDWNADFTEQVCVEEAADGDCGIAQCECDMWLAKELFDNRAKFKNKFSNDRGFEWQDECVATKPPPGNGGQPHVMACCGERPTSRMPFKQTEKRQCCGDTSVFTTSRNACCDGVLGPKDSC